MARVTSEIVPASWRQDATGLEPGTALYASAAYVPDDASEGLNTGFSQQIVNDGGGITFDMDLPTLTTSGRTNGPLSRPGWLYGWLRSGAKQDDPPIMLPNGVPAFSALRIFEGD